MNVGEVYRLKSGGPWMTITWFDSNQVSFEYFDNASINRAYRFMGGSNSPSKFAACFESHKDWLIKETTRLREQIEQDRQLSGITLGKLFPQSKSNSSDYSCSRGHNCLCGGDTQGVRQQCGNYTGKQL